MCYDIGENDSRPREVSAITMDIGKRIREAREEYGMSGAVLARRTGVAPGYIYQLEHDLRTPSVAMLQKIARELRTEPAEFLREPALMGKADAPETGQPPTQYITPAPAIEGEYGLPPTLEHDIDAAFARLVEDLRVAGLGSEEVLDVCAQWRAHVKALAGVKS
jgi:transcriptional regulator with XRE-family HTH domain